MFLNPARSIRFLISGSKDFSKIHLDEIKIITGELNFVVEAGAADGIDTQNFLISNPRATVYAIEPVKEQYFYLKNKFLNQTNVRLFNLALSDKNGSQKIYIGSSNGHLGGMGSSSLLEPKEHTKWFPEIQFKKSEIIQTITLDKFIVDNKIALVDLLWLDVQGKELDILQTAKNVLVKQIKSIHLECSRVNLYHKMATFSEIDSFMRSINFICKINRVGAISGNALYFNSRII
jgi:FkbM family methyltransferase